MADEWKITRFKWETVSKKALIKPCKKFSSTNFHLVRLSTVDSGSLLISEVQATDAGKYECSAQSMAGSRTAPPVKLKVLAPPTVLRGPQDTEVIEGDGLDLPCEVSFLSDNN